MSIEYRKYLTILALVDGLRSGRYQADTISGETTVACNLRRLIEELLEHAELKREVA